MNYERELFIAVPRTKEGAERFDLNQEKEADVYKWQLTIEEYKTLVSTKIFDLLNHFCGILIDDYENDAILDRERLSIGIIVVGDVMNREIAGEKFQVIEKLAALFVLAYSMNTGVHFYF